MLFIAFNTGDEPIRVPVTKYSPCLIGDMPYFCMLGNSGIPIYVNAESVLYIGEEDDFESGFPEGEEY